VRLAVIDPARETAPAADWRARLAAHVRGEIRLSQHDRLLYATDASIYQVAPLGVICPADEQDVAAAVRASAEIGLPILPRGGGTSLAGQCTASAVVVDLSPHLRKVDGFDAVSKTIRAQAGATLDEVNRLLTARHAGLFFAPDPATAAQASIGGCIGNNAAGARSIKYGRTSENIVAIEAVLADGQRTVFRAGAGRGDLHARRLALGVAQIVQQHAEEIRQRFPKTVRRNAGYGLDLILQQLDGGVTAEDLDLSGLLCGSEGTLAVVLAATLRLHSRPAGRVLAVAVFPDLLAAIAAVPAINASGATAVELLDDVVLSAAANNLECRRYLDYLPAAEANPNRAVLYVEYETNRPAEDSESAFAPLRQMLPASVPVAYYTQAVAIGSLWALRKAGEPLLHQIGGGPGGRRKPQTFVEDNAIPVERLNEFVQEFRDIVARHGTTAAYYAHASVGVLHIRPLIDLHDLTDRAVMCEIAAEVADLARRCGGVMSGEHGDGRARGPLLEQFYGAGLMGAFRQIKTLFDPHNRLNPGNIVSPGPLASIASNLRIDRQRLSHQLRSIDTYFDYTDQHGFEGAVEMCNGAGVCRKTAGGTMCPSYRGTLDERHSTRGRGNALRLAITGQLGPGDAPAWDDADTIQTLHLCLSCKACKSECPSNVDISRLKAEYTAQRYRRSGAPMTARFFGHVRQLNKLGAIAPRLSNAMMSMRPIRHLLNRLLGLAPQRQLPRFGRSLRGWHRRRGRGDADAAGSQPTVVLYEDCFAGFNDPHIGRAAVAVLEALGYRVLLPPVGCCGRAMISVGLLDRARHSAQHTLAVLAPLAADPNVQAILFLEPSCLSAIKDDWLQLKLATPLDARQRLAGKSMLVEEFVGSQWDQHPKRPEWTRQTTPIVYHGHCHQKALWGQQASVDALERVSEKVTTLATGCCGMAGSFGYTADRYDLSMCIGEAELFPAVRGAGADSVICASGTSCRHQIADGTQRRAVHPVEVLAMALGAGSTAGARSL
jgi:FAD/FMN-containing dehydrogenase/Fe-S oxidoreductase